MTRKIETSVSIAAAPSRVWSILMDFDAYPSWNPFIRSLKGEKRLGGRLEATMTLPGRKPQTFKPVVIAYAPEQAFRWRGSLPIPGLFTGEHRFALHPDQAGTRFEQSEVFTGFLIPFVGSVLDATELGFRSMNEALKARAERP